MNAIAHHDEAVLPPKKSAYELDIEGYKTLLESTRAIPWKLDWPTKRFTYIGPQIEAVLGWPQDSWVSVDDWTSRIHPDERDEVRNSCLGQSMEGRDHVTDYRAMTSDNRFVWIRDVVRVIMNDQGEIESLVGFMFDISERKRIELEFEQMQLTLERLSFEDGLTKTSNRRHFDERLQSEWQQAQVQQKPLSLILLDIDHFKQYNDQHGHIQGDQCLIQVASALRALAADPRTVVARFGGEEFAILLPTTDRARAAKFAEQCRCAIETLRIPHGQSECSPNVTASFGVGTIIPSANDDPLAFCDSVDKQLYRAKNTGRNRIAF